MGATAIWLVLGAMTLAATDAHADWTVTRDPFDANVIARYKAILARDPHDPALAKLLAMYRRYRTADLLAAEYRIQPDWAGLVVTGRLLSEAGNTAGALESWTKAVTATPDDVQTWILIGQLDRTTNKLAEARVAYDEALHRATQPAIRKQVLPVLADLAFSAADYAAADRYFAQLLELDPKNVRAWISRGDSAFANDQPDAALASFVSAEHLDPGRQLELADRIIDVYRRKQALPAAITRYETLWPKPARRYFEWSTLGELYEETGARDEAIIALQAAVASSPGELHGQRRLIQLLDRAGRGDEAVARYEILFRTLPREWSFQLELAQRYWPSRDEKALDTLVQLETRMPKNVDVLSAIAGVYVKWRRSDLALVEYEKLAKLDPDFLISIGEVYAALFDSKRVIEVAERIAARRDPVLMEQICKVMLDHALWREARGSYTKAIALDPKNPELWRGRAEAHDALGSPELAMSDAKQALSIVGGGALPALPVGGAKAPGEGGTLPASPVGGRSPGIDRKARHIVRHLIVRLVLASKTRMEQVEEWRIAFAAEPPDLDAGYLLAEYLEHEECTVEQMLAGCTVTGGRKEILERLASVVPDDPEVATQLERTPTVVTTQTTGWSPLSISDGESPLDENQGVTRTGDPVTQQFRPGLRVGVGVGVRGDVRRSVVMGATTMFRISSIASVLARVDWTQREGDMKQVDAIAASAGIAARVFTNRHAMLAIGVAGRSEYRLGEDMSRPLGFAGDLSIDLVSRKTPLGIGLRLEKQLGDSATLATIELALELR